MRIASTFTQPPTIVPPPLPPSLNRHLYFSGTAQCILLHPLPTFRAPSTPFRSQLPVVCVHVTAFPSARQPTLSRERLPLRRVTRIPAGMNPAVAAALVAVLGLASLTTSEVGYGYGCGCDCDCGGCGCGASISDHVCCFSSFWSRSLCFGGKSNALPFCTAAHCPWLFSHKPSTHGHWHTQSSHTQPFSSAYHHFPPHPSRLIRLPFHSICSTLSTVPSTRAMYRGVPLPPAWATCTTAPTITLCCPPC